MRCLHNGQRNYWTSNSSELAVIGWQIAVLPDCQLMTVHRQICPISLRTYPKTSIFKSEKSNRFASFPHAVSGNPLLHGINGFPIKDFGNDMVGFRIGTNCIIFLFLLLAGSDWEINP